MNENTFRTMQGQGRINLKHLTESSKEITSVTLIGQRHMMLLSVEKRLRTVTNRMPWRKGRCKQEN